MLASRPQGNHHQSLLSLILKTHFSSLSAIVTPKPTHTETSDSAAHLEHLVKTRCRAGNLGLHEALGYFNSMVRTRPLPSISAFNHLMGSLSKNSHFSAVIHLYHEMSGCVGLRPDMCTMNVVIKCFCRLNRVGFGFSVLGTVIKRGFDPDARTLTTLLHGLCAGGSMAAAMELFEDVVGKSHLCNAITYAAVINGFCKAGETRKALELLDRMNEKNGSSKPCVDCFSPVIDTLCKEGRIDESLRLFRDMVGRGVSPDVVIYTSLVNGMCKFRRREEATDLMVEMAGRGILPNVRTFSAVIDSLCKEEEIQEAISLFELMTSKGIEPDVVMFNSLIASLCKSSQWSKVSDFLGIMRRNGISPDIATFNIMLDARCKEGNAEQSLRIVEEMSSEAYNYSPFGRLCHLGKLEEESERLLFDDKASQRIYPNIRTSNIILNALASGGLMERAEKVFRGSIEEGRGPHIMSCNILIKGYCLQGEMEKARHTLDDMTVNMGLLPNAVSFNTVVMGYVKAKRVDVALEVLKEMIMNGLVPDRVTKTLLKRIHAYRVEASTQ